MAKRMKQAEQELFLLEGYNLIEKYDIFQKEDIVMRIAEAGEAAEKLDVELDDIEKDLDEHDEKTKTVKTAKPDEELDLDTDGEEADDDDGKPTPGVNKAVDINKAKYSLKLLLKLYDNMLKKVGTNVALPLNTIDESKGDVKKLGVLYKDKSYYEVFKTITDVHEVVCEGLSNGKESKYFEIFKQYLKQVEKNTPKFKKAYTKKQENIVKSIYIASVMYLFEMTTILSSCTVHMFNKGSKNFDKLLEETTAYADLFKAADKMYNDPESDIQKLLTTELNISESYNNAFLQSIDDTSKLDADIVDLIEGLNSFNVAKNKTVGLAHIAKLLKYGLSITLYKAFAGLRYVIYVFNYQKFSISNKINIIKGSLELVEADGDTNARANNRNTVTEDSMKYRADIIQATQKANIDASTNDKEEFDF